MGALTLLVHDPTDAISERTVQILRDWSASGWLDGFALVSVAEVLERGEALAHERVVVPPTPNGPGQVRTLARLIEGQPVRIAVLDPVGRDDRWLAARAVRHRAGRLLFDHLSGRVGAVDLMIPWHGGHWDPRMPAWPNWDTLIAAPQESVSAVDRGFDVFCDVDDPAQVMAVAAHAAAFTATAAALWVGVNASPWDHTDETDDVRMARAFHVRLDATEVVEILREAALSPAALRAPSAISATGTGEFPNRVGQLRSKLHLERPPASEPEQPARDIGAWAAIKMFFSFVWRSLVMAPSELAATMTSRTRSAAATRLNSAIFGSNSSMQVTVGGVGGRTSSWQAVRLATSSESRLDETLAALRALDLTMAPAAPPSAQEPFWRSTVDTVLALVSGERQNGVEPVLDQGSARWYTSDEIAPAATMSWRPVDGITLTTVSDEVPVQDLLTCDDALDELRYLSTEYAEGRDQIERNRRELERASGAWHASFLGSVGGMLVTEIRSFRGLVQQRMDDLNRLSEPPTEEADSLAASLSRFAKISTLVALVVGLVLALLDWQDVVPWSAWIWLPALILTWVLALAMKYLSVQRRIFQLLFRADETESLARRLGRELPVLVENLRRLHRTYDQYLVWAQLIPLFLNEPFGRASRQRQDVVRMTGYVPPSVVSGRYVARDRTTALHQATQVAWSARTPPSGAWRDFVSQSYQDLSATPGFASQVPEDVFGLEDTRLLRWLDVASTRQRDIRRMADGLAERLNSHHADAIVSRSGTDQIRRLVDESFLTISVDGTGVPGLRVSEMPSDFRSTTFSLDGLGKGLTRPDPTVMQTGHGSRGAAPPGHLLDEVGSVLVATQPLSMRDLALRNAPGGAVDDADDTRPAPAPSVQF